MRREGHHVIELRQAMPVHTDDTKVLGYASENELLLITCNRDDFLSLVTDHFNSGVIILVRRRTRQAECGHLLALLTRAGESGLRSNVNCA